jgi:hypothetical protein
MSSTIGHQDSLWPVILLLALMAGLAVALVTATRTDGTTTTAHDRDHR